jgi:type VI secretion system protein ImpF
VIPSLRDRLCCPRDGGVRPAPERWADLLRRDLEDLLNARRSWPAVTAGEAAALPLLGDYGAPDPAAFDLGSGRGRAEFAEALAGAIRRHEPRLRNVRVTSVSPPEGQGPRFRIEADLPALSIEPLPAFGARLEGASGRLVVEELRS